MMKDQTATQASHIFSITGFENQCHLSGITVDFTPPLNLNKTSNSIVPAFNKDRRFFTPAFILPRDIDYYWTNQEFERTCFQQRIAKAKKMVSESKIGQKKQKVVPNIVPPTKYCQICKIQFDQYEDHMMQEDHKRKISDSKVNNYIQQLSEKIKKEEKKKQKSITQRKIKKNGKKRINSKKRKLHSQLRLLS